MNVCRWEVGGEGKLPLWIEPCKWQHDHLTIHFRASIETTVNIRSLLEIAAMATPKQSL
jgi:hypothetical protein